MSTEELEAYEGMTSDELKQHLKQKQSDLVLAASLGQQLLTQNGLLETRVEELEKANAELVAACEHLKDQVTGMSTDLRNAESGKSALFAECDALRASLAAAQRELEAHADVVSARNALHEQLGAAEDARSAAEARAVAAEKALQKAVEAVAQADANGESGPELERAQTEIERLQRELSRLETLGESLDALRAENAELAERVDASADLEAQVNALEARNAALEAQNQETAALLDDVRATATSLTDAMMRQSDNAGSSLAQELAGVGASELSDEEAARLREEQRRQQELMELLSNQLKKAEDSMKGKEQEADQLRRELIKREQARKSGYLYKRGFYFGSWKKRFVLLEGSFMHYGESPNRAFDGIVMLRGARVEHSPATAQKRLHCFSIETSNRTYYFAADTEEEMVDWIVSVMAVVKEATNPSDTARQISSQAGAANMDPELQKKLDDERTMLGIYENQRRATPISSFTHTSIKWQARPPFSDRDGNDVAGLGNLLDQRRPSIKHGWRVVVNNSDIQRMGDDAPPGLVHSATADPTDEGGWQYAFGFSSDDAWSGECGATSFVRRRRWVHDEGIKLIQSKGDPLAARRRAQSITAPPAVIVAAKPVVATD